MSFDLIFCVRRMLIIICLIHETMQNKKRYIRIVCTAECPNGNFATDQHRKRMREDKKEKNSNDRLSKKKRSMIS